MYALYYVYLGVICISSISSNLVIVVHVFIQLDDEPFNPDYLEIDRVLDTQDTTDPVTNDVCDVLFLELSIMYTACIVDKDSLFFDLLKNEIFSLTLLVGTMKNFHIKDFLIRTKKSHFCSLEMIWLAFVMPGWANYLLALW